MSTPSEPERVKLVIASTYRDMLILEKVKEIMRDNYGEIDFAGDEYDFDFTDYYSEEMGLNLKKKIFSFRELIFPETITEIKWFTYNLEKKFSVTGKRQINLDPGYITRDNFMLATFKSSPHRIYLRDKVYGEIELIYENGEFKEMRWTYPDYRTKKVKEDLESVRTIYLYQLKELRRSKNV